MLLLVGLPQLLGVGLLLLQHLLPLPVLDGVLLRLRQIGVGLVVVRALLLQHPAQGLVPPVARILLHLLHLLPSHSHVARIPLHPLPVTAESRRPSRGGGPECPPAGGNEGGQGSNGKEYKKKGAKDNENN